MTRISLLCMVTETGGDVLLTCLPIMLFAVAVRVAVKFRLVVMPFVLLGGTSRLFEWPKLVLRTSSFAREPVGCEMVL